MTSTFSTADRSHEWASSPVDAQPATAELSQRSKGPAPARAPEQAMHRHCQKPETVSCRLLRARSTQLPRRADNAAYHNARARSSAPVQPLLRPCRVQQKRPPATKRWHQVSCRNSRLLASAHSAPPPPSAKHLYPAIRQDPAPHWPPASCHTTHLPCHRSQHQEIQSKATKNVHSNPNNGNSFSQGA